MENLSTKQKVFRLVKEFLQDKPQGARHSEIMKYLKEKLPNVPQNTLRRSMWDFRQQIVVGKEREVVVPERGLYILARYLGTEPIDKINARIKEEDFYQKFAEYLVDELEECTSAIPLGGNKFQDKWGTPDVLGIYKFSEADPIKPPIEIVSAEIKTDTSQLITAFGQACVYKIFSHKVYLVVPKQAQNDISRLESLCMKFGLGLIIFDNTNVNNPDFQIRTRAIKSEPDYYYVNLYIKKLRENEIKKLLR